MQNALSAAATGMLAQQLRIDTIANNLANVNTPGFKQSTVAFKDLLYRQPGAGSSTAAGIAVGTGATIGAAARDERQGAFQETGRPTDLAIEGNGFFRVRRPDGSFAYTRSGSFQVDAGGRLVTATGDLVVPPVTVPPGSTGVTVQPNGTVTATSPAGAPTTLGRLELTTFANPAGLAAAGDGLRVATAASGEATTVAPGSDGAGVIRQGYLEGSNVTMMTEMTALIEAQRSFGLLSKMVTAADEMHGIANSLKR